MLSNSFIHITGIGPHKERSLWKKGVVSWDTFLPTSGISLPKYINDQFHNDILESKAALACLDGGYFEKRMPSTEMWRLYPEFKDKAVFLDIETTGLAPEYNEITVVSLFDKTGARALVRGRDLEDFPDIISDYSLIVTYNGKCFDLPFLHSRFPYFKKKYAHIDLRYPLAKLGFRGGLKGIERKAGIEREGALSQVDGFMAVLLWREYEKGNATALDTLVRYGLEDVLNLKPLLEMVYNLNSQDLSISIPKLVPENLPVIDIPYDENLIRRLKSEYEFKGYST